MPIYMQFDLFKKTLPAVQLELHPAEVHGFDAGTEPTQADVDAVSAKLSEVYAELPAPQQAVLALLIQQAANSPG